ncbi:MAG TPA: VOC family protein [Thermoleophilaceae bacterium]|jgi:catechol 2,3-dioxygenase-like lactoylglutathione lyase family enzyme
MPTIEHLDLVVSDIERSLPFYRELLKPLGWRAHRKVRGERGETIHYLWGPGIRGAVGIRQSQSDAHPLPYDRYGVGVHHAAFLARSRRRVDERAEWLRGHPDARIESGPEPYDYTPGYYAVFFQDPDGLKLEIVHRPLWRVPFTRRRGAASPAA